MLKLNIFIEFIILVALFVRQIILIISVVHFYLKTSLILREKTYLKIILRWKDLGFKTIQPRWWIR